MAEEDSARAAKQRNRSGSRMPQTAAPNDMPGERADLSEGELSPPFLARRLMKIVTRPPTPQLQHNRLRS